MKFFLLAALLFVSAVTAVPVGTGEDVDDAEDVFSVDLSQLIDDLVRLHDSANDVIGQVEATLSTLHLLEPHTIRKRQTSVDGNVQRGPHGQVGGRVDVSHKKGNTVYNGNVSRGPGGTSWGAGVNHDSGNTRWGANVNRGRGGTSGSIYFGKTWGGK